nr:helix-turn-helix domain-containing protein [uncultured Blautia sp.]
MSQTGVRGSNGNLGYLTFDEASYLAKVSRSLINKWADKGKFKVIKVGSRVRISREDFEAWLEQRNLERSND